MKLSSNCKNYNLVFFLKYIEVIIISIIITILIKSVFIQPFKIPTNSMYPTFYGITIDVHRKSIYSPDLKLNVFNRLTHLSNRFILSSPLNGKISIPLSGSTDIFIGGNVKCKKSKSCDIVNLNSSLGIMYILYVNGQPINIKIQKDCILDDIICRYYFFQIDRFENLLNKFDVFARLLITWNGLFIIINDSVCAGDIVLDFNVFSGDFIFVDLISFYFIEPNEGESIVFHTKAVKRNYEKYYIKRLIGLSGDIIELKSSRLYINNYNINKSLMLQYSSRQTCNYLGYLHCGNLQSGSGVMIDCDHFYVMGDNSMNSLDSRLCGGLNEERIYLTGRAFFRFYPINNRWGLIE